MNLYKVSQFDNNSHGTYSSLVVVAESFEEARRTRPTHYKKTWTEDTSKVTVQVLGIAIPTAKKGIVLGSLI